MAAKRLLCFGDSNTYGWQATLEGPALRYPRALRWTGRLSDMLGPDWEVVEEGLGGRTLRDHFTVGSGLAVPGAGLCAKDYLPACLLSHLPLDAVVIMLGSNDMKSALNRSAESIAEGMGELADMVLSFPWEGVLDYPHPALILVSPPYIGERKMRLAGERYKGAPEKSRALAALYRQVAEDKGAAFLDAAHAVGGSPFGEAHGEDGMHLNEADHAALAAALFEKMRAVFS
ncbi:GDSL-type esterase/lipase family protein [Mailhella massiliensis]|uniref:GDSL-type esterase/lipase family protein n=1 Tax=Mailhella massiliensis TaxID=1903261 RepID=A0A921DRY5_9BACT|nr:GDSL-type esterase/lipase family protein [Mailhella massiliensis]HJD97984.1 GDSL-type esterase/lipase family protein [Mailhella massiliensis]